MMIRLAALLLACTGDKPGADADSDGPIDTVPSCGLTIAEQPEIRGSDPLFPLSRAVTIALSAPARLELTATDETGEEVQWVSASAIAHDLPLVGLHGDGSWTLDVRAIDDAAVCSVDADPVAFTTDPLPSPLPGIDVLVATPEAMAPGLTLVPIYTKDIAYIAYLDDAGRIVWLYGPTPDKFTEVRVLPSGNLLALTDIDVTEIDAMGVVTVWASASSPTPGGIPVAIPSWHHDVLWSARDTIVALSK
ncbi:MAG: hypothetical protein H0V89_08000, partial [Deltaproteobacteria bacterium]|nr:hypothetical protein [Deltaproteobacteria bacterium]